MEGFFQRAKDVALKAANNAKASAEAGSVQFRSLAQQAQQQAQHLADATKAAVQSSSEQPGDPSATTEDGSAAPEAKSAVQNFFQRAKEVANDIKENAKATAEEVWSGEAARAGGSDKAVGEDGWETYGVSEGLIAFVKGVKPQDFLSKASEWPKEDKKEWSLTPWQEKHVTLVLSKVAELRDCRYLLTPKKMSEQRFWEIYFALSQKHFYAPAKSSGDSPRAASDATASGSAPGAPRAMAGSADRSPDRATAGDVAAAVGRLDVREPPADDSDAISESEDLNEDLDAYLQVSLFSPPLSLESFSALPPVIVCAACYPSLRGVGSSQPLCMYRHKRQQINPLSLTSPLVTLLVVQSVLKDVGDGDEGEDGGDVDVDEDLDAFINELEESESDDIVKIRSKALQSGANA